MQDLYIRICYTIATLVDGVSHGEHVGLSAQPTPGTLIENCIVILYSCVNNKQTSS